MYCDSRNCYYPLKYVNLVVCSDIGLPSQLKLKCIDVHIVLMFLFVPKECLRPIQ